MTSAESEFTCVVFDCRLKFTPSDNRYFQAFGQNSDITVKFSDTDFLKKITLIW